jgi:hypothetical protein
VVIINNDLDLAKSQIRQWIETVIK